MRVIFVNNVVIPPPIKFTRFSENDDILLAVVGEEGVIIGENNGKLVISMDNGSYRIECYEEDVHRMDTITADIRYSEYDFNRRHPTLFLEGSGWRSGYAVDGDTGELRRICLCTAYERSGCSCGAWGDKE